MASSSKKPRSNAEVYMSLRRDWNGVNPVTKVIPDKRQKKRKDAATRELRNHMKGEKDNTYRLT